MPPALPPRCAQEVVQLIPPKTPWIDDNYTKRAWSEAEGFVHSGPKPAAADQDVDSEHDGNTEKDTESDSSGSSSSSASTSLD